MSKYIYYIIISFYTFFSISVYSGLQGRVIDKYTKQFIKDATIKTNLANVSAKTNEFGFFILSQPVNFISINANNYEPIEFDIAKSAKRVTIKLTPVSKVLNDITVVTPSFYRRMFNNILAFTKNNYAYEAYLLEYLNREKRKINQKQYLSVENIIEIIQPGYMDGKHIYQSKRKRSRLIDSNFSYLPFKEMAYITHSLGNIFEPLERIKYWHLKNDVFKKKDFFIEPDKKLPKHIIKLVVQDKIIENEHFF